MRHLIAAASFAVLLPMAASAATLAKVDRTFIHKAAEGGMAEVQEGQAAAMDASAQPVKDFAQKMVTDHTANNQDLTTLASGKGITVPTTLDKMHSKQVDALSGKTGPAFDTAYIADQIKGHEAMEKVMQTEIDSGTDADLKAFATKTLPVVQDHLKMAQALQPAK